MNYRIIVSLIFICCIINLQAQVNNTGLSEQMDSLENGKLTVSGMVDVYYGYDFNQPSNNNRPYFVSSARHNEVNINLAFIDLKYKNDKIRARFIPGFGTYVNSNYASEKGTLKNLIEANIGVKLFKNREIWIDAGVLGSPYTNESAISKDHFLYSRSLAPEYVPYYLSGVKVTLPINKKMIGYLYVLNGWQQIEKTNQSLSIGTQIEYRPTKKILLNWNTYLGNQKQALSPNFGNRYFTDLYLIFNPTNKFSITSCVYIGFQQVNDTILATAKYEKWWQANFIGKYNLNKKTYLAYRVEYFNDKNEVMVQSITPTKGFETFSQTLGITTKVSNNALFRIESRNFISDKNVFLDSKNNPTNLSNLIISNITIWF